MENDIFDSLTDLGYDGALSDDMVFAKAIETFPLTLDYTSLVQTLADELKQLCDIDETVSEMTSQEDLNIFMLELSSFLKEMCCPYKKLITGDMSTRLKSKEDRLLLLDYLIGELMAARMVNIDKPKQNNSMDIVMQESPMARALKDILISLKLNKPPPNITPDMLFKKIEAKLQELIQKEGEKAVGKPLYNKTVTDKQWRELSFLYKDMLEDYTMRREMLITRLECTIQSFEWSDRLKDQREAIQSAYRPIREKMVVKPEVEISDFLAARTSLLQLEKTSSANVRKNTQSEVNKVIIGQVPDRGGRPNEQQPPPPEMPSWQQRSNQGGGSFGGRGGRGGGAPRGQSAGGRGGHSGGPPSGHQGGNSAGGGGRGAGGRGAGRVQGGYNQGYGDQRPQPNSGYQSQGQRNYQTYEVPPGGYSQSGYDSMGGYGSRGGSQSAGGYSSNPGGYSTSPGGYSTSTGGYNTNSAGYNTNSGGYNTNSGGYSTNSGGYNQNSGSYGGGYNQGGGNRGSRGGYHNEHDDRDRRGKSNYNRGGRR